jgi:hypothetical protein
VSAWPPRDYKAKLSLLAIFANSSASEVVCLNVSDYSSDGRDAGTADGTFTYSTIVGVYLSVSAMACSPGQHALMHDTGNKNLAALLLPS